jgi:hypothetical protein
MPPPPCLRCLPRLHTGAEDLFAARCQNEAVNLQQRTGGRTHRRSHVSTRLDRASKGGDSAVPGKGRVTGGRERTCLLDSSSVMAAVSSSTKGLHAHAHAIERRVLAVRGPLPRPACSMPALPPAPHRPERDAHEGAGCRRAPAERVDRALVHAQRRHLRSVVCFDRDARAVARAGPPGGQHRA